MVCREQTGGVVKHNEPGKFGKCTVAAVLREKEGFKVKAVMSTVKI